MGKRKIILSYGGYTLEQDKFDKLIKAADKQEQTTLKVLYNAVVKCINDLNVNSTAVSVKDWEATKNSYKQYADKLWLKYFPAAAAAAEEESPKLNDIKAVIKYLTDAGWRVKKSTAYNHHGKGLLRPAKDGKYTTTIADKYALVAGLKRIDGKKQDQLEKLNEDRQSAETRKTLAQAEHQELRTKILNNHYVPRESFERELAQRAMVFKTDDETFCRSKAPEIIALVGGDKEKIPDLVEFMLAASAKKLSRYSEDREFTVPAPAAADIQIENEPDKDEEIDEGETEE
jgi:hypothetical protein